LSQVAKAVNMSSYYFCKMFKKITGINFTDYVARCGSRNPKTATQPEPAHQRNRFEVGFQCSRISTRVQESPRQSPPATARSCWRTENLRPPRPAAGAEYF